MWDYDHRRLKFNRSTPSYNCPFVVPDPEVRSHSYSWSIKMAGSILRDLGYTRLETLKWRKAAVAMFFDEFIDIGNGTYVAVESGKAVVIDVSGTLIDSYITSPFFGTRGIDIMIRDFRS